MLAEEDSMQELLLQSELSRRKINKMAISFSGISSQSLDDEDDVGPSETRHEELDVVPHPLTDSKKAAENAIELELASLKKENGVSKQQLQSTMSALSDANNKIARLENELLDIRENSGQSSMELLKHENSKLSSQLLDVQVYLEKLMVENSQLKQNATEKLSLEKLGYENQLQEAHNVIFKYKAEISHLDAKINTLRNSARIDLGERIRSQESVRRMSDTLEEVIRERDTLTMERRIIMSERNQFQTEASMARSENLALKKELAIAMNKIVDKESVKRGFQLV